MKKFFSQNTTDSAPRANKKKLLIFVTTIVLAAVLVCPTVIRAAEYLSENDPIVTLSYLRNIFAPQLKEEIKSETEIPVPTVSVGYEVLELTFGQTLTSNEGTVELILRPGSSAQVVSDSEQNGLSDISAMCEVLNGEEIGVNHALIIPRNDGRGITITSEKAYVLVRGDYKID